MEENFREIMNSGSSVWVSDDYAGVVKLRVHGLLKCKSAKAAEKFHQ